MASPGRPSRIYESWTESRCPECEAWVRSTGYERHYAGLHDRNVREAAAVREVILAERLIDLIRAGNRPEVAAGIVGISRSGFHAWMQRGAEWSDAEGEVPESEAPFLAFLDEVRKARDEAEGRMEAIVFRAAASSPAEARWWMERARPDGWSRRETLRVGGADGGPIRVDSVIREPDFIAEVQAKLIEAGIIPGYIPEPADAGEDNNGAGSTNGSTPY